MKAKKLIVKVIISVCLFFPACIPAMAQDISEKEAYNVAMEIVGSTFPVETWQGEGSVYIRNPQKTGYPFYICDVAGGGFIIVAKDRQLPRVLGFSYESSFPEDPAKLPESVKSLLESYSKINADVETESGNIQKNKNQFKSLFVPPLLTTKWKADSTFCSLFPDGSMEKSSAVIAMAQVFKYYGFPDRGIGTYCYLYGNSQEEICQDFTTVFDFSQMSDTEAGEQVPILLKYMAVAGRLQPEGTDMVIYKETLPEFFFYSDNMRRMEYWEHDFIPVLKNQLKMKRPVPAEWKGEYFVIDGYYDENFFHFNFGRGGELDGFYLVDFPMVKVDSEHMLLNCFVNYHPKSRLPKPESLDISTAGDSLNFSWEISIPDSLTASFDKFILLKDGVIPVLESSSSSVMVHPADIGISSNISCVAVFNTYGVSELSEPVKYISDLTLADIPSLELRQAINIQLGYTENLNRIPYMGELELVKKLEVDFEDQRGIDLLTELKFLFIDGILITGLSEGDYLGSLNYVLFHRCRQFNFSVFEHTNSLNVIRGSDGLPYDLYELRHNADASVISLVNHDDIINNMGDLYGADKYFPNLTHFDLFHITYLSIDSCYISYESYNDILPNIKGADPAMEHTSPSSFVPCYPTPARNVNAPNTSAISWEGNFNDESNVFYNVYIGKTRDQLPLIAPFYTQKSFNYNFENGLDYYWRVEAFHSDTVYYSGIYHFSTHESMPLPFFENFDEYYSGCDVSYESPWWSDFGDNLPEPTSLSKDKKHSGRYSLEVVNNSDVGLIIEPYQDSVFHIGFLFQNNRTEFVMEILQGSNEGDTVGLNSYISLFGDNLGTFNYGDGNAQFLFTPFDWNLAEIDIDQASMIAVLKINGEELARWNWSLPIGAVENTNPFRGLRFKNEDNTGSAYIDDLEINFSGSTSAKNIVENEAVISYQPITNEIVLSGNTTQIQDLHIFDLSGRKIFTFACHGEERIKLDDRPEEGIFIVQLNYKDGSSISKKFSVLR